MFTINTLPAGENRIADMEWQEIVSVPFPRKLAVAGTPPGGSLYSRGTVRHVYIHDVVDHGVQAGSPTEPTFCDMYDALVNLLGWIDPAREHAHGLYIQNYGALGPKVFDTCMLVQGGMATAFKIYAETSEALNKTSNIIVRNSIALGWVVVQSLRQGLEDITIENCVIVGDVRFGYGTWSKRLTFRNNLVFGNLDIAAGEDMVIENNQIVARAPYRPDGHTYGAGNYGMAPGGDANYVRLTMAGNVIYTDRPQVAWNGWSRTQALYYGVAVRDTVTRPLADLGPVLRRYPIYDDPGALEPVHIADNVFIYNPSGADEVDLGAWGCIRDVRRWNAPYAGRAMVMAGEPDPPLWWLEADGPAPIKPSQFPTFGFARVDVMSEEEIDLTIEERLNAALLALAQVESELEAIQTQLADERTAHTAALAAKDDVIAGLQTANAAKDAEIAALALQLAEAATFRAVAEGDVLANLANAQALAQKFGVN